MSFECMYLSLSVRFAFYIRYIISEHEQVIRIYAIILDWMYLTLIKMLTSTFTNPIFIQI